MKINFNFQKHKYIMLNFIDWLENNVEYMNGETKPSPEIQKIANNIITKSPATTYSSIQQAPTKQLAQKRLISTVQKQPLNSRDNSKLAIGDVAKAVDQSLNLDVLEKI